MVPCTSLMPHFRQSSSSRVDDPFGMRTAHSRNALQRRSVRGTSLPSPSCCMQIHAKPNGGRMFVRLLPALETPPSARSFSHPLPHVSSPHADIATPQSTEIKLQPGKSNHMRSQDVYSSHTALLAVDVMGEVMQCRSVGRVPYSVEGVSIGYDGAYLTCPRTSHGSI